MDWSADAVDGNLPGMCSCFPVKKKSLDAQPPTFSDIVLDIAKDPVPTLSKLSTLSAVVIPSPKTEAASSGGGSPATPSFRAFSHSSIGPLHSVNEDRFMFADLPSFGDAAVSVFGVFDGHGGHICSEYLARHLERFLKESPVWVAPELTVPQRLRKALEESLARAEKEFCKHAMQPATRSDSGACLVVGVMCGGHLCIANIGDCVGILHFPGRNEKKGVWIEVTRIHRSAEESEMRRIERAGGMVINGRAFGVLEPSRSIGDIDVKMHCAGAVISDPYITEIMLGDRVVPPSPNGRLRNRGVGEEYDTPFLILCSDGVFDFVKYSDIVKQAERVLKKNKKSNKTPENPAKCIVRTAIKLGTMDDCTALVCELFPPRNCNSRLD